LKVKKVILHTIFFGVGGSIYTSHTSIRVGSFGFYAFYRFRFLTIVRE